MSIVVVKPNKEYELTNVGKITILDYEPVAGQHEEKKVKTLSFGAKMVFKFNGLTSFGKSGDAITFVQTVADDFSYQETAGGKDIYTWSKNRFSDFNLRNYDAEDNPTSSKDIPLNHSIDQCVNESFAPFNYDFRYPEWRNVETESLTNEDTKISYVLQRIKEDKKVLEELNLKELDDPQYNTDEKKKEEIKKRLNSDENIVPHVAYSAKKQFRGWLPGRMADSPLVKMPMASVSAKGSQSFETLLVHYDQSSKIHIPLCTLCWGWQLDWENKKTKLFDIVCKEMLPAKWNIASRMWNNYKEKSFKIPELEFKET